MSAIDPEKVAALEKLYAQIPEVHCQGKCADYCGVIAMGETERLRALAALGHPPDSKAFPDMKNERDVEVLALLMMVEITVGGCNLKCPALSKEGKCTIYKQRPAICRLWGAVKQMSCPHGCRPKKFLTDSQSSKILKACTDL